MCVQTEKEADVTALRLFGQEGQDVLAAVLIRSAEELLVSGADGFGVIGSIEDNPSIRLFLLPIIKLRKRVLFILVLRHNN